MKQPHLGVGDLGHAPGRRRARAGAARRAAARPRARRRRSAAAGGPPRRARRTCTGLPAERRDDPLDQRRLEPGLPRGLGRACSSLPLGGNSVLEVAEGEPPLLGGASDALRASGRAHAAGRRRRAWRDRRLASSRPSNCGITPLAAQRRSVSGRTPARCAASAQRRRRPGGGLVSACHQCARWRRLPESAAQIWRRDPDEVGVPPPAGKTARCVGHRRSSRFRRRLAAPGSGSNAGPGPRSGLLPVSAGRSTPAASAPVKARAATASDSQVRVIGLDHLPIAARTAAW